MTRRPRNPFARTDLGFRLEDRLAPAVLRVDAAVAAPPAAQDGSNWARAFDNLQAALAAAAATPGADQIWLAGGTYRPSQIYSPLDAQGTPAVGGAAGLNTPNLQTFDLPDRVSLYGGFVSGMTGLGQRDPDAHPTTLSGDLLGNDVNDPAAPGYAASKADNVWHIVTAGNDVTHTGVSATLDGLRFVGGHAVGPNNGGTLSPFIWGHSDGGGVYSAWGSDVTLNDDFFAYNHAASDGGGVFSDGSDLVARNSTFLNNSAGTRAGALEGLHDFEVGSHSTLITGCYFQDNTSLVFGGAVVGEGAYQGKHSEMTIRDSTFVRNRAAEGGAVVIDTLPVLIDDCTFLENVATVAAGALATTNVVATIVGAPNTFETTISDTLFRDNVCLADAAAHAALNGFVGAPGLNFAYGGGALVAYMNGYLNVVRSTFVNNEARHGHGGAILNGNASANLFGISAFEVRTTVSKCRFDSNRAPDGNGGAIASLSDGLSPTTTQAATAITVRRSVFTGNAASGRGGAVYLADTVASVAGNQFSFNSAPLGDGLFGIDSQINGLTSSDPNAGKVLKNANTFVGDDLFLA